MKAVNLRDQRFGRLVAKRPTKERLLGHVIWECECDCGDIKKVSTILLRPGGIESCGCLRKETAAKNGRARKTHGHKSNNNTSGTYHSWISMKTRCTNKNHIAYKNYGGRRIKVCERWSKFKNFLEDMGERPKGLTIDREDNDGNYEPGNCRWATRKEQTRNSIQTKLNKLKVQVIKKLLKESKLMIKEIAEIFMVKAGTITAVAKNKNWKDVE